MGPPRLHEPDLLPRGRPGWPLRRVGAAGAVRGRDAGGDDLGVAASRASPSVLGQGLNIGRGVTIVLVHGAFADASGWQDVIPILQRHGFNVIAVQNPLSSLAGDVAWTRRVIEAQSGS